MVESIAHEQCGFNKEQSFLLYGGDTLATVGEQWEGSSVGRPVRKEVVASADPRTISRESPLLFKPPGRGRCPRSHHELLESKQMFSLSVKESQAAAFYLGPGPHTCMKQPRLGGSKSRAGSENPENQGRPVACGKSLGNRSGER